MELNFRGVGGTGGGFPVREIDDEGRGAGFGGGFFKAAIEGKELIGKDSAACGLGLNPFILGTEGADIAGAGGGLGAELDGGLKFVTLFCDSESE